MKKFSYIAVILAFVSVFAASASAQTAANKIGWVDTLSFEDEKEGVTRYINALKALETELRPRITELQNLQNRIKTISDDLTRAQNQPANSPVPVDRAALQTKAEEGNRLQREFEFKKKDYDAVYEKRSGEVLGPISMDISRAMQDFAKARGYAAILDIAALANSNMLLALDPTANITKEFVTFYNARPPTAATAGRPN
jgi:Skp family chaperone for outer membrane proteins